MRPDLRSSSARLASSAGRVSTGYDFDTRRVGDGAQNLRYAAEDAAGNWSYDDRTIHVDNAGPEGWSHPQISRVLRVVGRQPFRSPLIEAWELLQLSRMYQAAADVFEDLTVDLIGELRGQRPDEVLAVASGSGTIARMEQRIERAYDARGGPGDPRRYPSQFRSITASQTSDVPMSTAAGQAT